MAKTLSALLLGLFLGLLLLSSACTHLNSVSLTPIPSKRKNQITAESSRMIFFLINFNNSYVDSLVKDLKSKCKGGVVKGILTKDESVMYFPVILHQRKVTATGYCLKG